MHLRKKRVALVALALCFLVAFVYGRFHDLQAESRRQSVLSVYKEALAQPYMNWDELEVYEELTSSDTSHYQFGLVDLNSDGYCELLIKNPMTSYASGQYRLYTVRDGLLTELLRAQSITINEQTHMIFCEDTYMGNYWGEYCQLEADGQLTVLASYEAVDTNTEAAYPIIYNGRLHGISVHYTSFRIGEQNVAYEDFTDQINELVDGGRFYTQQLAANTEENRQKLL